MWKMTMSKRRSFMNGELSIRILIIQVILIRSITHVGGYNSDDDDSVRPNGNVLAASSADIANESTFDTHRIAKRMQMDLESCLAQFDVHKNTIIRTSESQGIGGKYLQGIELANSLECQRLCCETENCDVYVFEEKSEGYCYMFNCGPPENFRCKFTRHANYTSAVLTTARPNTVITKPHSTTSNVSQQELELNKLKSKPTRAHDEPVNFNSTPAAVLAATNTDGGPISIPVAVPQAKDVAAVVSNTQCGRFQFQCHSGECIAVYNACDGIPQCEDSSDEGPECSGAAVNTNNLNDKSIIKTVTEPPPQYQIPFDLQTSQQQLQSMQQHQPVQSVPVVINNREDVDAWANRKTLAKAMQLQPTNSGGLQLANNNNNNMMRLQSATKDNLDTKPIYMTASTKNDGPLYIPAPALPGGPNVVYITQSQPQQQGQQQQQQDIIQNHIMENWAQTQLQQAQQAQIQLQNQIPAGAVAAAVPVVTPAPAIVQLPQGSQTIYMPSAQLPPQQTLLPPPATSAVVNAPAQQKVDITASINQVPAKENSQNQQGASVATLNNAIAQGSVAKQPIHDPVDESHKKPIETDNVQPDHVAPVHEQYKMIHANLAMEFRNHDHDGHSDRPSGAVLSLTLGLLVTAALAILIGCRMRTVGRPVRRAGKAPYAHEADFLVNGMYL